MGMGAYNLLEVNADILSFLDEVLDYPSDGVFIVNADGKILYVNRKISSLLGFTKDELLGANIGELYVNSNSGSSSSIGSEVRLRRSKGDTINCFEVTRAFERENGLFYKLIWSKKSSLNGNDLIKKLVIPISYENRLYGAIWLYSNSEGFTNEELGMINDLAGNLALALKTIEIEKKRKEALEKMKDNLDYFEYLADRLRNPLAIMRGFVDVREDVGAERTFKELSNQINRMKRILDNLRVKEEETFKLKENLIR